MRKVLALAAAILLGLAALTLWSSRENADNNTTKDAELPKLYEHAKSARIRITYQQRDASGVAVGTWIYAQDGDTSKAYIRKGSKWVMIGGTGYRCDDVDTRPRCDEIPGGAPSIGAHVAVFATTHTGFTQVLGEETNSLAFTKSSHTTIAGREAVCATVTVADGAPLLAKRMPAASGTRSVGWESCLDNETGAVLRIHLLGAGGAGTDLIATLVEAPTEADFATPDTSARKRSTRTSTGSSRATPDTSMGNVTATTAIGCALTVTLTPGATLPRGTTVPCLPRG